ncbi:hypothetical protein HYT24_01475 [Candidatus Pacearchaeota archaeon]|nr:hypothetical protein [Candidatus Pacearchaeota archaeon]
MPKEKQDKKEKSIDKLKVNYTKLQKKYSLPSFDDLNEEFSIEKVADHETEYLLREVRRMVAEKVFNYLRTVETLINPTNAPMFVFSIVKSLKENDKKTLTDIYKELAKNELELIKLDLKYSEEKEAEFIKKAYKVWEKNSKILLGIIDSVEKNWDAKSELSGKSYFG